MDGFMAEIRKIPPVTRFLCASSLAVTIPVLMNIVSPYKVVFVLDYVLRRFELWRLHTSFFLGGGGINYIFELVMLYRTTDQLESGPYSRRSADLAYQLLYAGATIIVSCTPLSSVVFTRPLLLCLTYLSSALAPLGAQTSLMGLVTLPVKYLPYLMIGMDLLMGGPRAAAESVAGAAVGHFWWWSIWGGAVGARGGILETFGRAPGWMRNLVGEGDAPPASGGPGAGTGSNAGTAGGVQVIPPRQPAGASGGSSTRGYNWGSGQRLGRS
ncbi:DER1-domain-containing protein [Tricholoma matsutake]|nr:DER1-domain-containing protein [Tricholoma matsutake 945]